MKISARKFFLLFTVCCLLSAVFRSPVFAQITPTETPVPTATTTPTITPTPGGGTQLSSIIPGDPNWQIDAEVTQVGKNAERSRQLVYWVIKHPLVFKVPSIVKVWASVRNIAYAMSLLVIIGLALHLVFSVRNVGPTFSGISLGLEKLTLFRIILRIAGIILFITFSYIAIRLLVEGAEILGRFFIEFLGGEDLFNIVFSGGNVEQNYTDFVGYRNLDPLQQEMANTSLFIIRLTSFTYNFMSVVLILRQVILLFLLIISPFLAILLPFIFIRNTGFVWIGEFFRWLFYGPLFALFISALAQIWKAGIPFTFDFTRARNGEVVYPTAVNILYGGPSQLLTPTNTANYIDTYAEYVIALVMLWAAIILPWLLLRIFRDYCCDILKDNQNALLQILDKLRNLGLPPTPPPPKTGPALSFGLPFRKQVVETKIVERENIWEKIRERNIENIKTTDLLKSINLEVRSLTDVARTETNRQFYSQLQNTLNKIQNPASIPSFEDQRNFAVIKEALISRAAAGDITARNALSALSPKVDKIPHLVSQLSSEELKQAVEKPGMPAIVPQIIRASVVPTTPLLSSTLLSAVAQKTQLSREKVEQVLRNLPLVTGTKTEKTEKLAQKTALAKEKVEDVLNALPSEVKEKAVSQMPPTITIEEYEEVKSMWLNHYRKSEIPLSDVIKSRDKWLEEDVKKLTNTINLLTSASVKDRQRGVEEVANLLPFLLLGGFGDLETITYIKAKLEAAKLVMGELMQDEKAKEQAEKEKEKVKVPLAEEKEEAKQMEAEAKKEIPIPEEEPVKIDSNNPNLEQTKTKNSSLNELT